MLVFVHDRVIQMSVPQRDPFIILLPVGSNLGPAIPSYDTFFVYDRVIQMGVPQDGRYCQMKSRIG